MTNITIVFHSGYGHTAKQAEAVRDGAAAVSVRRRHTDSVARFVVHLTTQCQEFMDDG